MKIRQLLLFLVLLCVILLSCGAETLPADVPLRIYFLDVGQGDCILIRTHKGDVLIDSGPDDAQTQLCMRLQQLGVRELQLAIFTHGDEDHIGGGDGVLDSIPTQKIWLPFVDTEDNRDCLTRLLTVAKDKNIKVESVTAGNTFLIGTSTLTVLSPFDGENLDSNDGSIIIKLTCGNATAMFFGDAGAKTEALLLERYARSQLNCDLYKAGHHGSSTSGSAKLLEAMSPDFAVISCAAGNSYGHPHGVTLARLSDVGAMILRTDLLGEISFDCNGEEFVLRNKN